MACVDGNAVSVGPSGFSSMAGTREPTVRGYTSTAHGRPHESALWVGNGHRNPGARQEGLSARKPSKANCNCRRRCGGGSTSEPARLVCTRCENVDGGISLAKFLWRGGCRQTFQQNSIGLRSVGIALPRMGQREVGPFPPLRKEIWLRGSAPHSRLLDQKYSIPVNTRNLRSATLSD